MLFIGWLGFNAGSVGEMNGNTINAFIVKYYISSLWLFILSSA
ncbi:hypothetical protein cje100_03885 [Campylobacter jejuni subsp. jejuni LMG 23216]|nr:hypothetical protein cje100_03885 [Campylobacter jejuni subsp. jejuni LMG 23216]